MDVSLVGGWHWNHLENRYVHKSKEQEKTTNSHELWLQGLPFLIKFNPANKSRPQK